MMNIVELSSGEEHLVSDEVFQC